MSESRSLGPGHPLSPGGVRCPRPPGNNGEGGGEGAGAIWGGGAAARAVARGVMCARFAWRAGEVQRLWRAPQRGRGQGRGPSPWLTGAMRGDGGLGGRGAPRACTPGCGFVGHTVAFLRVLFLVLSDVTRFGGEKKKKSLGQLSFRCLNSKRHYSAGARLLRVLLAWATSRKSSEDELSRAGPAAAWSGSDRGKSEIGSRRNAALISDVPGRNAVENPDTQLEFVVSWFISKLRRHGFAKYIFQPFL